MPVQFIGGSSGGGTTDVRTTFAAPILNDALANTTTIVAQYQIPANYLTINDMLNIKYIAQFGVSNSGEVPFYLRIGTTGTISDTQLPIVVAAPYNTIIASNYGQIYLDASIYFFAVGTNGLVSAQMTGITKSGSTASSSASRPFLGRCETKVTVDTTQPLYISLVAAPPTTAVIDTLGSYISVGY